MFTMVIHVYSFIGFQGFGVLECLGFLGLRDSNIPYLRNLALNMPRETSTFSGIFLHRGVLESLGRISGFIAFLGLVV